MALYKFRIIIIIIIIIIHMALMHRAHRRKEDDKTVITALVWWLVWRSSSGFCHINKVKLRLARLVLGGSKILVFYRPTQPNHPSLGRRKSTGDGFALHWGRNSEFCVRYGPCDQGSWHTGCSRLNALTVNLIRSFDRYGLHGLIGSNSRRLKLP